MNMLFHRRNLCFTTIFISLCTLIFSFRHDITPNDLKHVLQDEDYLLFPPFNDDSNPDDDFLKCIAVMRKYCNVRTLPSAQDCVEQAIITWRLDIIPNWILKDYYLKFTEHQENLESISQFIMNPTRYCDSKPTTEKRRCEVDLAKFKETSIDALKFALYETKLDEYCVLTEEYGDRFVQSTNQNAYDYMLSIRRMISVHELPHPIPEPMDYCGTISSNARNIESPLDWTPYLQ